MMFGKYRLRRQITRILHEEFGFEEIRAHRALFEAVCHDAVNRSLGAYDAAVVFMLRVLAEMRAGVTKEAGFAPLDNQLANARIGTIARLIDSRKVTPGIVDAWLGQRLRELRQAYA